MQVNSGLATTGQMYRRIFKSCHNKPSTFE